MEAQLDPSRGMGGASGEAGAADREADQVKVVETTGDVTVIRDASGAVEIVTATEGSKVPVAGNVQLHYLAVSFLLAGTDILCLAASLMMGDLIAFGSLGAARMPLLMVVVASILWVGVFYGFKLYATQHLTAVEEFKRVVSATSVGVLVLMIATFGTYTALSRTWIGLIWSLTLVFELGARRFWRSVLHRWRKAAYLHLRTLVVGAGPESNHLYDVLDRGGLGYKPIGHITSNGLRDSRTVGSLEDLIEAVRNHGADCLFVASSEVSQKQMAAIRRAARVAGVELRVSANLPETLSTRISLQPVGDLMALTLFPVRLTGAQAAAKRAFDLTLGVFGLVIASPILLVTAVAIKLTSKGPVLFRQERVTSGGRAFTLYKFRTMAQNADELLRQQEIDKSQAFLKLRVKPPLTSIGGVLRKFSIDELPQLWNIVKGDMSLVGPRPLPVEQVAANLELLEYRHDVRAGLTGWWQINGRSDVDPAAAVRMDLFYIENWSLALDVYIIVKTLGVVLRKRGAY